MPRRVQIVRHTLVDADAFTGLEGEITIELDNDRFRIHDGTKAGGHVVVNEVDVDAKDDVVVGVIATHAADTSTHGVGVVAGVTEVQTLTNKTLTAPVVDDPVINGAISGDAFLDENDLTSDAADKVASQQSIKAYADAAQAAAEAASQTLDAMLTSLAALGTAADKLLYTTDVDTVAELAFPANAQTFISAADFAAMRAALGVLANLVEDATPELGGDLNLNGKNIDFPSTSNISDCLDEDDMATDSATMLATQQSIKAYVDINAKDLEFVSTAAITVVTALAITGLAAGYDYFINLEAFAPTDNTQALWMRFSDDGGTTYEAGAADYQWETQRAGSSDNDVSDSEIQLVGAATFGNNATNVNTFEIKLINPNASSEMTTARWTGVMMIVGATPQMRSVIGGARFLQGTDAVDAVQFLWSGGSTFKAQGDITVWRRKRS